MDVVQQEAPEGDSLCSGHDGDRGTLLSSSIKDQQKMAAAEINNLLNPKWEHLPSDMNNYTPLFRQLRNCLSLFITLRKASNNAKNRLQVNTRKVMRLTEEFAKDDFMETLYEAAMRAYEQEWGVHLAGSPFYIWVNQF